MQISEPLLSAEKFSKIRRIIRLYDTLGDAAFRAICSAEGISSDDLIRYAAERTRRTLELHNA